MNGDDSQFRLLPQQASQHALQVDHLFLAEVGLIVLVVGGVLLLLIVFAVRYRAGRSDGSAPLPRDSHARRWEIAWSLAPLPLFGVMFVIGAQLFAQLGQPPADALRIDAIGKQWMWKFQHPSGQREINELHLPLGRNVHVTLISQDVIHSFYVPALRIKQDVLPGRYTATWFRADRIGRFNLFCAEYCGTEHSRMRGHVTVMTPEDYSAWLSQQPVTDNLAVEGRRLYRRLQCGSCHDPDSGVDAPSLHGIFGRQVQLADGSRQVADLSYLRDAILLPQKQVVAGYPPLMPSYQGQIDEAELLRLIAWLRQSSEVAP